MHASFTIRKRFFLNVFFLNLLKIFNFIHSIYPKLRAFGRSSTVILIRSLYYTCVSRQPPVKRKNMNLDFFLNFFLNLKSSISPKLGVSVRSTFSVRTSTLRYTTLACNYGFNKFSIYNLKI